MGLKASWPIRLAFLTIGVVIGVVLPWAIPQNALAGYRLAAFLASTMVFALCAELIVVIQTIRTPQQAIAPAGALPADGEVELGVLHDVNRSPNEYDPRFFAFRGLCDVDGTPSELRRPSRSSPPLLGRIALVSVFLGRDGRAWSDREIADAHAALLHAATWIEDEAMRWQARVNLQIADTYFVIADDDPDDVEMTFVSEGEGVGPFEARAATKALIELSRGAALLGFGDAEDWMARINARIAADVHVWLLHPRRAGRSMAVPLERTEFAGVSLAVCYAREASFPEPLSAPPFTDPATVAHELLHLFGASDKYGRPLQAFEPGTVSRRDIMRLSESRLARLRVDPRTAWEIGWTAAPRGKAESLRN